jgi:UMF1 family MFS transporter
MPSATNSPEPRRERRAWYFYDWANSAFPTTVLTVLLGPYLTALAHRAARDGMLWVLGVPIAPDAYYPYLVALSVGLQVLLLPLLGALADSTGWKKRLLLLFAYLGAAATVGLYWVEGDRVLLGGALFVVANLCFGASVVMYNAFLPELASPEERDVVSSRGWAIGYLGGGILLAGNLLLLSWAPEMGLELEHAVRICLASAGVWWGIFTLIPALGLRERAPVRSVPKSLSLWRSGWSGLAQVLQQMLRQRSAVLFLAAYFLYNDGVQTVIALAGQFAVHELGIRMEALTATILMVQFVAFAGALLFGVLGTRLGTKRALLLSLLVWMGIIAYSGIALRSGTEFTFAAAAIGLVLGGTQALSRSMFSLFIPKGQEAGYFGLYEISERGSSWFGPLLFGLVVQFTGSYRWAIAAVGMLFLGGAALLWRVRSPRAPQEVQTAAR